MRRLALAVSLPLVLVLCGGVAAGGVSGGASGAAAHAVRVFHRPILAVHANQSNNWSGYNQGALEKGKMFHSVSGEWVVPTATASKNSYSSSWVGIGGGCLDAGCNLTDSTLIQAGTEQDVDASERCTNGGTGEYGAWWEIIPLPAMFITDCSSYLVSPGDRMHVDIGEVAPNTENWNITIKDLTKGWTYTTTERYASSYATAEWIEETPVVLDNSGNLSVGPLPNLGTVPFDPGTANAGNPGLTAAEAIQLVDLNGAPLATPSAPDTDTDGFNDCTHAATCSAVPAS